MKLKRKECTFSNATDNSPNEEDEYFDLGDWEPHQALIDKEDYPGLVRYCEERAARHPDDLYAQYYLGNALVLNNEFERAIEFMAVHHKKHPWNFDYRHVILDALFALGKTEDDFNWVKKPTVLKISTALINTCYEFLKGKRNPRSILELHSEFITEGYMLFSEKDLLNALSKDARFVVENSEKECWAKVRAVRAKRNKA